MPIIQLTEHHKQQYKDFVTARASGSFLQSWDWGEFQTQLGKSAIRYGIFEGDPLTKTNNLIGTVQFLKTKIPRLPGYYLYAPYGPILDRPFATGELITQIKDDFKDCWFIRLEPKQPITMAGKITPRIQPGKTFVTNLTQSVEELQLAMHQKTRYNIKVATKHNIVIQSELTVSPQHGFHIAELIELLAQTSDRQKFRSYGSSYYERLIDFFMLHGQNGDCKVSVYKALRAEDKKLLAAAIMIDHGATRTYLFGGSNDKYRNLMAPYALHWRAMLDAKTDGLKNYDWWGIETASGQTPGFVQFKLKWGGKEIKYPNPVDIVIQKGWYVIYQTLRRANKSLRFGD